MAAVEFGAWTHEVATLKKAFAVAKPFEHVVIPNFLSTASAEAVEREFPDLGDPGWVRYHNPIEKKYALNDFSGLPATSRLCDRLQSPEFVDLVRKITGIEDLERDPLLHGAGLHFHPRGGKLDVHLDYSIHPLLHKERRVNLILYLNKDWDRAWGGDLQLWNSEFTRCEAWLPPVFNTAVLFRTSDVSFHGLPAPLTCPEGVGRKSMAIYYVSEPRQGAPLRHKAEFRPLPWQPHDARLARLYEIRRARNITPEDLEEIWPTWEAEGQGFH